MTARPNWNLASVTFTSPDYPGKVVGRPGLGDYFDAAAALVATSSHLVNEVRVTYSDGTTFTLTVDDVTNGATR